MASHPVGGVFRDADEQARIFQLPGRVADETAGVMRADELREVDRDEVVHQGEDAGLGFSRELLRGKFVHACARKKADGVFIFQRISGVQPAWAQG